MEEPAVAIVSRDRPGVLQETLECFENRGLLGEVLVVDGSNEEETSRVCKEFDVEHHFQNSSGMTAARNEALEHVDSEFVVFVDDDVRVSESWYDAIQEGFEEEDVVGVTGKLEDEELEFSGFSGFIRNLLFGGRESFGEILPSGVVNGDFFYDESKEVDHMPGCNMAFDVEALRGQDAFDEDFDVGSSFAEDTAASLRVGREGRIVYEPEASLKHLKVGENRDEDRRVFFDSYMSRFLQSKYSLVDGFRGLAGNLVVSGLRYGYYLGSSVRRGSASRFFAYIRGDLLGLWDFWLRNRKPEDRF